VYLAFLFFFCLAKKTRLFMKEVNSMAIPRQVISIGLYILSGLAIAGASYLDMRDSIDDMEEEYREKMDRMLEGEDEEEEE
jgi:hypothetical protein